jgi:D-alanyl-D-alanine endopeptidase (penicillin-binding protein 7)
MRTLILLVLVSLSLSVGAKQKRQHVETTPVAYAIWDLDEGRILADKNVDLVRSQASITKLMTVLVALERGLDLDERIEVIGTETSRFIKRGMLLTRRELIDLALVASDNLAANTLAETSKVNRHEFIGIMNIRARMLGMTDTRYTDATGLSPFNVSTVYDIKMLTEYLEQHQVFAENANRTQVQVSPKNKNKSVTVTARNTNVFASKLDITAAKTGFTSAAGRCLTMFFRGYNNRRYILVVLGAHDSVQRQKMVQRLIDTIR